MGTIHKIDQEDPGNLRTAFIALAADKNKGRSSSTCLTENELACLVDGLAEDEWACLIDGKWNASELDQYFEHLAYCDICYQQWLELTAIAVAEDEQQGNEKVRNLFKPANLAWGGSFLAAAASVVLFLNIQQDAGTPDMEQARSDVKSIQEPSPEANNIKKKDSITLSAESAEKSPATILDKAIPEMEALPSIQAQQAPAPLPQPVAPEKSFRELKLQKQKTEAVGMVQESRSTAVQVEGITTPATTADNAVPKQLKAANWLRTIQQQCLVKKKETDNLFWEKQYENGKELLAYRGLLLLQAFNSAEEKRQVIDILPYIEQLQTVDQNNSLCKKILERLEKSTAR